MNSPGAHYLQDIVGADAVQQGSAQAALGVKAVGDRLIVRLTKRVPDFPARTTMPYFCPVQKDLPIEPEGVGAPLPGSRGLPAGGTRGKPVGSQRKIHNGVPELGDRIQAG